jgi:hypothetical protein
MSFFVIPKPKPNDLYQLASYRPGPLSKQKLDDWTVTEGSWGGTTTGKWFIGKGIKLHRDVRFKSVWNVILGYNWRSPKGEL